MTKRRAGASNTAPRPAAGSTPHTLHGVFMRIHGLGVLLTGPSGVGKSELALELLTRGHRLIADDATEFIRSKTRIVGICPPLLAGFLEARSLGILNIRRLFGPRSVIARQVLDLMIQLEFRDAALLRTAQPLERLEGRRTQIDLLGASIPQISLPIRLGHNLAVLVEAACRDLRLRQRGYRADEDFVARQLDMIQQGGG